MYDIEELYEAESPAHAVELLREHPGSRIIVAINAIPMSPHLLFAEFKKAGLI